MDFNFDFDFDLDSILSEAQEGQQGATLQGSANMNEQQQGELEEAQHPETGRLAHATLEGRHNSAVETGTGAAGEITSSSRNRNIIAINNSSSRADKKKKRRSSHGTNVDNPANATTPDPLPSRVLATLELDREISAQEARRSALLAEFDNLLHEQRVCAKFAIVERGVRPPRRSQAELNHEAALDMELQAATSTLAGLHGDRRTLLDNMTAEEAAAYNHAAEARTTTIVVMMEDETGSGGSSGAGNLQMLPAEAEWREREVATVQTRRYDPFDGLNLVGALSSRRREERGEEAPAAANDADDAIDPVVARSQVEQLDEGQEETKSRH